MQNMQHKIESFNKTRFKTGGAVRYCRIFFLFFILSSAILSAQKGGLIAVTEEWPPYNYTLGTRITGLGAEIVNELFAETGYTCDMRSLPWNRAYYMAETMPNVLIFSMARTAEREKKFKWVGKIAPRELVAFKLKSRKDLTASNLQDLKKYVLGVPAMEDATTQFLVAQGFETGKNLMSLQSPEAGLHNIKLLFAGRIDILPINEISLVYQIKQVGLDFDKLEKMMVISGGDEPGYYMAFSPSTPDETVQLFVEAYKKLVSSGRYDKILKKYIQ